MSKVISLNVTPQEFFLLKSAMQELCNDSDLIWGNADESEDNRLYQEAERLLSRLDKIEQTEVIPH